MSVESFVASEAEILGWLRCEDSDELARLWLAADAARRHGVGDAVHLRGLVEISNHCRRGCAYCGIRAGNRAIRRYRMSPEEIVECARQARAFGYGTVVLQAGEDPELTGPWVGELVARIKGETGLAVTLSLGERAEADLARWREAGADRYLLRFETSDPALFRAIHPPAEGVGCDRIAQLGALSRLGYELGSGVMVGIPGQSYASLARDLVVFRELDLDMIGIGPFIPHPATPLGRREWSGPSVGDDQAPATELMVYKLVALARLACPEANLPSTTALATLNRASGRENGLERGANVVMPNLTPVAYRRDYEIYPAKVCISETGADCQRCLLARIAGIGRVVGTGPGGRRRSGQRLPAPVTAAPLPSPRRLPVLNRA